VAFEALEQSGVLLSSAVGRSAVGNIWLVSFSLLFFSFPGCLGTTMREIGAFACGYGDTVRVMDRLMGWTGWMEEGSMSSSERGNEGWKWFGILVEESTMYDSAFL
jgi:hypothetical protein